MHRVILGMQLVFIFYGCAPVPSTYITVYESHLDKSSPKSLQFKDDKFEFEFSPYPNGVYFMVKNINGIPAFMIWDRCYFVEPNGNSSKALNVDELGESSDPTKKSKYESPIPSNGKYGRFTTSSRNLNVFKSAYSNSAGFNLYLYDNKGYPTLFETNARERIDFETFYKTSQYWPDFVRPDVPDSMLESSENTELENMRNYLINNNNMGLGLGIKLNDSIYDYKFDFKIHKVTVFKTQKENGGKEITKEYSSASDSNSWVWNPIIRPEIKKNISGKSNNDKSEILVFPH